MKKLADDDADAMTLAPDVLGVLRGGPTRAGETGVAHQWGSVDPHGSDHAAGIGIDIFKGRGKSPDDEVRRWTNSGFKDREDIVHRVIKDFAAETAKYDTALGYEALSPNMEPAHYMTGLTPGQARSLSLLVYKHASDIRKWVDDAKNDAVPPKDLNIPAGKEKVHLKAARKAFHTIRDSIYYAVSDRKATFSKHVGNTAAAEARKLTSDEEYSLIAIESILAEAKRKWDQANVQSGHPAITGRLRRNRMSMRRETSSCGPTTMTRCSYRT